jgi:DNA-directed RNA polymerase specialized sigma24 family protein
VKSEQEQPEIFAHCFLRSYRLLHFIACRVVGNADRAPIALKNCWRTASRNPPHFEHESGFRSWLVRVLIDEALAIFRESLGEKNPTGAVVNVVSLSGTTQRPKLG